MTTTFTAYQYSLYVNKIAELTKEQGLSVSELNPDSRVTLLMAGNSNSAPPQNCEQITEDDRINSI